jgi:hypothetical protein
MDLLVQGKNGNQHVSIHAAAVLGVGVQARGNSWAMEPLGSGGNLRFVNGRFETLPLYLPELNEYLLDYPRAKSENVQAGFYWEKVNFGLKPTFRIVQKIIYHGAIGNEPVYAVAEKQIYASHYFQTALDLSVCVKDPQRSGFYIITVKGSKQAGLTGLKGSIVRKVAVDKTRSSLERVLVTIKQKLESQHAHGD